MEKYDILDVIDEGAYGIVWKAVNRENNSLGTPAHSEWLSKNSKSPTKMSSHEEPFNDKSKCLKC